MVFHYEAAIGPSSVESTPLRAVESGSPAGVIGYGQRRA